MQPVCFGFLLAATLHSAVDVVLCKVSLDVGNELGGVALARSRADGNPTLD